MTDEAILRVRVDGKGAEAQVKRLDRGFNRMATSGTRAEKSARQVGNAAAFMKRAIAGLGLGLLVRDTIRVGNQFIGFENALTAVTGSSEQARREMSFVSDEAERLGINIQGATKDFTLLSAASAGTALEGQKTRDIFSSVAESARVLNLSAADTSGALRAISQIMSKGTVQAEELRGQLGERVPGAFQIMARAIGVTTEELNKMLEQGEVIADEVLPLFAAELRRVSAAGLELAVNSPAAEFERLNNQFIKVKKELGTGLLLPFLAEQARTLTKVLGGLADFIRDDLANTIDFFTEKFSAWGNLFDEVFGQIQEGAPETVEIFVSSFGVILDFLADLPDLAKFVWGVYFEVAALQLGLTKDIFLLFVSAFKLGFEKIAKFAGVAWFSLRLGFSEIVDDIVQDFADLLSQFAVGFSVLGPVGAEVASQLFAAAGALDKFKQNAIGAEADLTAFIAKQEDLIATINDEIAALAARIKARKASTKDQIKGLELELQKALASRKATSDLIAELERLRVVQGEVDSGTADNTERLTEAEQAMRDAAEATEELNDLLEELSETFVDKAAAEILQLTILLDSFTAKLGSSNPLVQELAAILERIQLAAGAASGATDDAGSSVASLGRAAIGIGAGIAQDLAQGTSALQTLGNAATAASNHIDQLAEGERKESLQGLGDALGAIGIGVAASQQGPNRALNAFSAAVSTFATTGNIYAAAAAALIGFFGTSGPKTPEILLRPGGAIKPNVSGESIGIRTGLGGIGIENRKGDTDISSLATQIADFDNAIASIIGSRLSRAARDLLSSQGSVRLEGNEIGIRDIIQARFNTVLQVVDAEVANMVTFLGGTLEDQIANLGAALEIQTRVELGTDIFKGQKPLQEVFNAVIRLADAGESLGETYDRLNSATAALDTAAGFLGLTIDATRFQFIELAADIQELAGGADVLNELVAFFARNISPEAFGDQFTVDEATLDLARFNNEMGLTGDSMIRTREGLSEFVQGLDLTTEAGQRAFLAALRVAPSLVVFEDFANVVQSIADFADSDPVSEFAENMADANLSLTQQLERSGDAIRDLVDEFDGSVDKTHELAEALADRYQLELEFLAEVDNALRSVTDGIDSAIQSIQFQLLGFGEGGNEAQFDFLTDEADRLAATLGGLTDPTEIANTVAEIRRLSLQAFNLLDPEQQQQVGAEFITFLEDVQTIASDRLIALGEAAANEMTELRDLIRDALIALPDPLIVAANALIEAANALNPDADPTGPINTDPLQPPTGGPGLPPGGGGRGGRGGRGGGGVGEGRVEPKSEGEQAIINKLDESAERMRVLVTLLSTETNATRTESSRNNRALAEALANVSQNASTTAAVPLVDRR